MRLGISGTGLLSAAFAENGFDAGDVAPHLAHPRGVFELTAGALKAQVDELLRQIVYLLRQFVDGARPQIGGFHALHDRTSSPGRATKRVAIGSFAAASSNASRATSRVTPSSSNMMRPG